MSGLKHIGDERHLEQLFPGHKWLSTWSSPEKFARHVAGLGESKAWHSGGWDHGEDFSGTKDMPSALKLAQEGWKEGAQQVERLRDLIIASHPIRKRPIVYGIAGSIPSIPRAVAGNPMNMINPGPAASRRRPVISLISDMSAHCGVGNAAISNRAAAVATIVDQIESKGFATEVLATACTRSGYGDAEGFKAANIVVAKDSSQPVDLLRLAYALGHTSFFRRLVFADWGADAHNQPLGRGLGHTYEFASREFNDKNYYVIPSAESRDQWFKDEKETAEKGVPYLVRQLQIQKCPAFPLTVRELEAIMDNEEKEKKSYRGW